MLWMRTNDGTDREHVVAAMVITKGTDKQGDGNEASIRTLVEERRQGTINLREGRLILD